MSGFPLVCPYSCIPSCVPSCVQEPLGAPKFFNVSLPACHGLRTPADLSILAYERMVSCCLRCALKPSASATSHVEAVPALQETRFSLRPTGCSVYASPILFTVSPRFRHGRKTRYGWVANPYPTGTFTLQETPSFAWRENGVRYPLVGGTRKRHFDGTNFKPRKLPENAQTPTSRVHAVLGGNGHQCGDCADSSR